MLADRGPRKAARGHFACLKREKIKHLLQEKEGQYGPEKRG